MRMTPEELAARNRRNLWLGGALVAFMVLVFATTVLRMKTNSEAAEAARQANIAAAAAQVEATP